MKCYMTSLLLACLVSSAIQAQDFRTMMPRFPVISREDVQKELKLTDEQISKVNEAIADVVKDGPNGSKVMMLHPGQDLDAIEEAVTKVLNEKQRKRMKEVWLQITGGRAFVKDEIAKEVGLSKDQRSKVSELQQEMMTQMREMAFNGTEEMTPERLAEIKKMQKDQEAKIEKLLTKEQMTTWTTMKGAKFEMKTGTAPKSPK